MTKSYQKNYKINFLKIFSFESCNLKYVKINIYKAGIAQMVEQLICNQSVKSSILFTSYHLSLNSDGLKSVTM